jgi:hypothetical protein
VAQVAQVAFSFVNICISITYTAFVSGTSLAQVAFSKLVCATLKQFVPSLCHLLQAFNTLIFKYL